MPDVFFVFDFLFSNGGIASPAPVADTAKDLPLRRATGPIFWIGQIGRIGDDVDLRLAIGAVALLAIAEKRVRPRAIEAMLNGTGLLSFFAASWVMGRRRLALPCRPPGPRSLPGTER